MVRTSLTKAWVLVADRSGLASIAATAIQRIFPTYLPCDPQEARQHAAVGIIEGLKLGLEMEGEVEIGW